MNKCARIHNQLMNVGIFLLLFSLLLLFFSSCSSFVAYLFVVEQKRKIHPKKATHTHHFFLLSSVFFFFRLSSTLCNDLKQPKKKILLFCLFVSVWCSFSLVSSSCDNNKCSLFFFSFFQPLNQISPFVFFISSTRTRSFRFSSFFSFCSVPVCAFLLFLLQTLVDRLLSLSVRFLTLE